MDKGLLKYESNEELTDYLVKEYSVTNKPIPISFKDLFPHMNKLERYTHLIHAYPAKLLPHIPYFFLNNEYFSNKGDVVLDPFCGTGTVLLEANLAGRNALGADANPLARKIAIVKTQRLDTHRLNKILVGLLNKAKLSQDSEFPEVRNMTFWFPLATQIQLSKIRHVINELPNGKYKSFFEICFSNCIKKVSYADPRIAVPVKLNPNRFEKNSDRYNKIEKKLTELLSIDVFEKFKVVSLDNIERVNSLSCISKNVFSKVISENARILTTSINRHSRIKACSVDLILTSPPYAGAQKYIRSSSLNLGWLGLAKNEDLKILDQKNIGRENYSASELREIKTGIESADKLLNILFNKNKLRAYVVGNYLLEMQVALDESIRVLKNSGYLIIIIGNNKVCNMEFNTQEYLTEYIQKKGLKLQLKLIDDIKSYGLMTKRNKTADIISREWILVFKK